jgi:Recombinase
VQLKDETRLDAYGNATVIGTQLVIEPDKAQIVREIFTPYANDYSQRAIAAQLNERGISSCAPQLFDAVANRIPIAGYPQILDRPLQWRTTSYGVGSRCSRFAG